MDIDSLTNVMFVMAGTGVLVAAALVAYALWLVTEIQRRLRELHSSKNRERNQDWPPIRTRI